MLDRLHLEFEIAIPGIDETAGENETPDHLVVRLAREKARNISEQYPAAIIIGSDQVAEVDGQIMGKPGTLENAFAQLRRCSGRTVRFLTAVNVQCLEFDFESQAMVSTDVVFRILNDPEIARYLDLDMPLDCAGAFKSETAGISLLQSMQSSDPTAIIGLPLISLAEMLRDAGLILP